MNKIDFEIHFHKLANNQWDYPPKAPVNELADLYYDKFRNMPVKSWAQIVDKCLETDKKFPPISKLFTLSKQIISDKTTKSYKYSGNSCPLCIGGYVGMLLAFNKDGKIIERHFWSIGRRKYLQETKGIPIYEYAFHCRCEKGNDTLTIRGGKGYQISWEEYEELKLEAAKPGGIGAAFHLRDNKS